MTRVLRVRAEAWPLKHASPVPGGGPAAAEVVVVEVAGEGFIGRGECAPSARHGETVRGVVSQVEIQAAAIAKGMGRNELQEALPAGAARNAVDCALWDLEAKIAGHRAWELAGLQEPAPVPCARTIAIDAPDAMGRAAAALKDWPLLRLELDSWNVVQRVRAVHEKAPGARLVVDARGAWSLATLAVMSIELSDLGVEMIEQPLPPAAESQLESFISPVPLCTGDTCRGPEDLAVLGGRYQMIAIRLDRTGGLTQALRLAAAADDAGLGIVLGCTAGTSLGMAPATLLGGVATVVDLDAPLRLERDRDFGFDFTDGLLHPPEAALWG